MGVLARPLMFQSVQHKLEAIQKLEELANSGRAIEYSKIRLYNPNYGLNQVIHLLFRVVRHHSITKEPIGALGPERYEIEIEVPVEHESLEGEWSVKEKTELFFLHYVVQELERFAILVTEGSSKGVRYTIEALRARGINPTEYFVKMPTREQLRDFVNELGEVGWIWIGDIRDTHIRHVGAAGRKLQNSEIIEDLLQRGGKPKAIIIESSSKNVKVVLSERGTIYSQTAVQPIQMAQHLTGILKLLIKYKLITSKI